LLTVEIKNATLEDSWRNDAVENSLFSDVTKIVRINYVQKETDYIDFDRERLIPHKLSQYGPGLAAGDVDGNGLDDICIGGSANFPGKFFLQQINGKFIMKSLPRVIDSTTRHENMGLLLFDADDGDLIFIAQHSVRLPLTLKVTRIVFINDGKGNFR
jgi:hypothetical protein